MSGPARPWAPATRRGLSWKIELADSLPSDPESGRVNRPAERIFGVVLAGGRSRRFGRSKVLTPLAGAPMASWSIRTLQAADLPVGVVSDEEGVEVVLGVPVRPDLEAGLGPLGGLWTALQWALERGDQGVLLIGCDMPLVSDRLVRTVLNWSDTAAAVVPMGSDGPEPLCALYRLSCAPEVERRLRSEELSLRGLAEAVGAASISHEKVAEVADPLNAFLNVNTTGERDRAEALLVSTLS